MAYSNFSLAIYCNTFDLKNITSGKINIHEEMKYLKRYLNLDKVYLETYRSEEFIDETEMKNFIKLFNNEGIKTSGGITLTVSTGKDRFESFCYTNQNHKKKLIDVVSYTAKLFEEIIFDDFFFTNCKCESCIKAKGDMSWSEFRTDLLAKASMDIKNTAKTINPNINLIIKYPNWYDHYQETGYNVKEQSAIFDMIYTGTETRDSITTQQNLPRYLSYFLMRYMENVKPSKNGGGWFDSFDCGANLNYYVEQAYLTMFSKPREITLFCLGLLTGVHRMMVPLAGYAFETVDKLLEKLGNPTGIDCYKPYNSYGEDYLHNFIGMLGIPLEPRPELSTDVPLIFLAESSARDENILDSIEKMLINGKTVIITSGLLKELYPKGFDRIANIIPTDKKACVNKFGCYTWGCSYKNYYTSAESITIPQVEYFTNDVFQVAVALDGQKSYPVILNAEYGNGNLFVLTIPDNLSHLYLYPEGVLNALREIIQKALRDSQNKSVSGLIRLKCGSGYGLFAYDNNTFIVESFKESNSTITIVASKENAKLSDLITEKEIIGTSNGEETEFAMDIAPLTYKAFKIKI